MVAAPAHLSVSFPDPWLLLRTDPDLLPDDLQALPGSDTARDAYGKLAVSLREAGIGALALLEVEPAAQARALVSRLHLPEGLSPEDQVAFVCSITESGWASRTAEVDGRPCLRMQREGVVEALAVVDADGMRLAPYTMSVRYVIPMLDGTAVVVDFETPTTAYADEFERIFDATASQIAFD